MDSLSPVGKGLRISLDSWSMPFDESSWCTAKSIELPFFLGLIVVARRCTVVTREDGRSSVVKSILDVESPLSPKLPRGRSG